MTGLNKIRWMLGVGLVLVAIMSQSCAGFYGDRKSNSGDEIVGDVGRGREVYVEVRALPEPDRQSGSDTGLAQLIVPPLERKIIEVMRRLNFRARNVFIDQFRSLSVEVTTAQFRTVSVFGQVELRVKSQIQCLTPSSRYQSPVRIRRSLPNETIEEAREHPDRVLKEQSKQTVSALIRKLFKDSELIQCLVQ